jgi:hypothetical protein
VEEQASQDVVEQQQELVLVSEELVFEELAFGTVVLLIDQQLQELQLVAD